MSSFQRDRNLCNRVFNRQISNKGGVHFQRTLQVTPDFIRRIGLEVELEGHAGCVNCLEWNEKGTLLASGSDDVQVIIWDPFAHKAVTTVRTGHTGNIFTVKFLPSSNDGIIVSGAADSKIRVHELTTQETTQVFSCHVGRVKRIATASNVPFMFWSAAEDGTIMQFDLRDPKSASGSNPQNVLINLNAHMGPLTEAKCLAVNPLRPELLAVGANDPYVRLYDRRMLSCKSIKFPTESSSRMPWERPYVEPEATPGVDYSLPAGCVQYFVAGHLPQKLHDYKKKYRTLASTYLNFSADGNELLVNLGGEQIYLFNVNKPRQVDKFQLPLRPGTNGVVKETGGSHSNGFTLPPVNGTTNNGVTGKHMPASSAQEKEGSRRSKRKHPGKPLPPAVEAIKQAANAVFEKQQYNEAIDLYNRALAMVSDSPILHGNRAAAYMKRKWDGDLYAAMRDCQSSIRLDPDHLKAHFRLAKCLFELSWTKDAFDCLQIFKEKFPEYATSNACLSLDRDIRAAIYSKTDHDHDEDKSDSDKSSSPTGSDAQAAGGGESRRKQLVSDQELLWRSQAFDYDRRFCGHCNTTTDIKEANFFGSNSQYIVAGSDDGSFFIWDKATTNMVRALRGDDSIVNCLQPHPTSCLLATSGIDPVVRLWSPRPEDGKKDQREVDNSEDAASANQRRMNADPLEFMLMNMGYRISGGESTEGGEEEEGRDAPVNCRPS